MSNIHDMPAGPDLNRLVAEKVMGWAIVPATGERADGRGRGTDVFHPSTDLTDAWEVVEKMRGDPKNNWFTLNWYGDSPEWYAGFGDGSRQSPGEGATAPLAICRAALHALT